MLYNNYFFYFSKIISKNRSKKIDTKIKKFVTTVSVLERLRRLTHDNKNNKIPETVIIKSKTLNYIRNFHGNVNLVTVIVKIKSPEINLLTISNTV